MVCTSFMLRAMLARSLTVLHGKAPPCPFRSGRGFLKPFECSENGVDRLGLFRIGKYPVFRRNVLRPVVILLEALRDCRHIPTGSEYAALVDTHIPPVCFIIEVVLNVLRYLDGPQLVGVKTAQPFIIGNIRVKR